MPAVDRSGLCSDLPSLLHLLPELERLRGLRERSDWHNDDPYEQSLRLYHWVMTLSGEEHPCFWLVPDLDGRIDPDGMHSARCLLALVALLHDLGKSEVFTQQEDGSTRCEGHEEASVRMAKDILGRWDGFSRIEREFIHTLVRDHGEPYQLYKQAAGLSEAGQIERLAQFEKEHPSGMRFLLVLACGDFLTSHIREINPGKFALIDDFYTRWRSRLLAARIQDAVKKNTGQRWGLTLVSFLPAAARDAVAGLQNDLHDLTRKKGWEMEFYDPSHLHTTQLIIARSQAEGPIDYEDFFRNPFGLDDLAASIDHAVAARGEPWRASFNRLIVGTDSIAITLEGALDQESVASRNAMRQHLISALNAISNYDEKHTTKHWDGRKIYCTIGYLKEAMPEEEYAAFSRFVQELRFPPLEFTLETVSLVHHQYRTLAGNQLLREDFPQPG
jgi:hypothetical protein